MPWKVTVCAEPGFIETVYTGRITKRDSSAATVETLALANSAGVFFFLSDLTDAQLDFSTVDIFNIPTEWESADVKRGGGGLAVVVPADGSLKRDAEFYEDTCRNRGWNVRVFTDRRRAVEWLTSGRAGR